MRGARLLVLIAGAGLAYGGWQLGQTLLGARPVPPVPVEIAAALEEAARTAPAEAPPEWPALFDPYVPDPPAPAAPTRKPEPWRLVGLVAGGEKGWAILAGSGGDRIVRRGDSLPGGDEVLAIEGEGVRLARAGGEVRIGFDKTPQSLLAGILSNDAGGPLEAELPLSLFTGRDMRRVLGRAGSVRMVAPNGGQGDLVPEILWARPGEVYDLIGLRQGDKVMRVNGYSVSDPETLARAEAILSESDQLSVEILRAGQRRMITVRITGRG